MKYNLVTDKEFHNLEMEITRSDGSKKLTLLGKRKIDNDDYFLQESMSYRQRMIIVDIMSVMIENNISVMDSGSLIELSSKHKNMPNVWRDVREGQIPTHEDRVIAYNHETKITMVVYSDDFMTDVGINNGFYHWIPFPIFVDDEIVEDMDTSDNINEETTE